MAGINLPGGYSFDPATGEISGNGIPRSTRSGGNTRASTRTNTSRSTSSYYRANLSLWDRINNFFIGIGNWIATNGETAMTYISFGLLGLFWLGFAISIIVVWVDEGFIWALIAGVIGGGVMYLISGIALAVLFFIDDFILLIVRYIFYNVYTFLIALAVLLGSVFLDNAGSLFSYSDDPDPVEQVVETPSFNIYYCTASSVLNVRSAPSKDAQVIGTLRSGQEVRVYNFVDGFAKIDYNDRIAYASSSYLKKQ